MPLPQEKTYTIEDIYSLPDGQRAELIDGRIYNMAPPSARHQDIIFALSRKIADYIDRNKGNCKIYLAPYAVFLNADEINYVEPDISVICDKQANNRIHASREFYCHELEERGCNGAPDWIIEVVSPSTERMDYGIKLFKYRSAGVREYWVVNPFTHTVNVYDLEHDKDTCQYRFEDDIAVCIYKDLHIKLLDLIS